MKTSATFFKDYKNEILALALLLVGGSLSMLGLIRLVPLVPGILGIIVLAAGMFWFCLQFSKEKATNGHYKESFEIEHETIAEEIQKSMAYHRYQEAVINRYESACRDIGLAEEQKDWLLTLLMEEKSRVDEELRAQGGGHI